MNRMGKTLRNSMLAAALSLLPATASASETRAGWARVLIPDHVRLQFAGGLGLVSTGAGYGFLGDRLHADILYGYAPASVAGKTLHAISQKTTLAPAAFRFSPGLAVTPLLIGYSANVGLGDDYFLIIPERFRDYYWPSALRFWYFGGAQARANLAGTGPVGAVSTVAEVGAHDAYWQAYFGNRFVDLADILSLSLAVRIHIRGG